MSTISIEYDDQEIFVKLVRDCETVQKIFIDKHTNMEDVANELYDLLEEVAGSYNVSIDESM